MPKTRPLIAFAFLVPNITGFLVFTSLPVVAALVLSLFRWDLIGAPDFVGLQNFRDLLGWHADDSGLRWNDPGFWQYLGNTLFLMLAIPANIAASLFLAIVLKQKLRGRTFFRTIFYVPVSACCCCGSTSSSRGTGRSIMPWPSSGSTGRSGSRAITGPSRRSC